MNTKIQTVTEQPLAAVIERVSMAGIGAHVRPNLDKVHAFLIAYPEYRLGHASSVLVYRGKDRPQADGKIAVEYAVEVEKRFKGEGVIVCTSTPAGRVATAVHAGPYHLLPQTHAAIQHWCRDNGHTLAGVDWEIYGDWNDDFARLETTVCYLLA